MSKRIYPEPVQRVSLSIPLELYQQLVKCARANFRPTTQQGQLILTEALAKQGYWPPAGEQVPATEIRA